MDGSGHSVMSVRTRPKAHHGGRGADGDGKEEGEETKHLGWSEYEKALNSN